MTIKTKYAPAERLNEKDVKKQSTIFEVNQLLSDILERVPAIFLIINKERQIVYMNNGALEFTGLDDVAPAIGKRPGEIIGCIHSDEEEGGCGTSEACTYCGAVNAVLKSQTTGQKAVMDCKLILGPEHQAYDLRVWASPLNLNGVNYTVLTIQDIKNEKWRGFLERIFFHDLLNIMTALIGNIELLKHNSPQRMDSKEIISKIETTAGYLLQEINSQQTIINAENETLNMQLRNVNSKEILNELSALYQNNHLIEGKTLKIDPKSDFITIFTDKTLLRRVLGNMIKNALEATPKGGLVIIGCSKNQEMVEFWVYNPGFIPRDVQLQIFTRSFSTKGTGRGLGTYSMKLLSKFLKGEVSFNTSKEIGTKFKIMIPISF